MPPQSRREQAPSAQRFAATLAVAVLLLPACAGRSGVVDAQVGTLAAGTHELTLRHGGRNRQYRVFVPQGRGIPLRPVMLAFHGGGGNARQFQETAGLDAVAQREGFLVVYPDGIGVLSLHTWNAGGCCGRAMDRDIDDIGFVRGLLDELVRRAGADPRRIYATGHSNGAMMTYRVAAELGDRIAAAIPVGGAMHLERFTPVSPVPILHIHSVDDPRALYDGGEGPPFPGTDRTVVHKPVEAALAAWRQVNGCPQVPTTGRTLRGAATGANAGQTATELRWEPCASGSPVVHWKLTGSGHGWPGQTQRVIRESIIGPPTTLIDAAEEAWRFAAGFTKP